MFCQKNGDKWLFSSHAMYVCIYIYIYQLTSFIRIPLDAKICKPPSCSMAKDSSGARVAASKKAPVLIHTFLNTVLTVLFFWASKKIPKKVSTSCRRVGAWSMALFTSSLVSTSARTSTMDLETSPEDVKFVFFETGTVFKAEALKIAGTHIEINNHIYIYIKQDPQNWSYTHTPNLCGHFYVYRQIRTDTYTIILLYISHTCIHTHMFHDLWPFCC